MIPYSDVIVEYPLPGLSERSESPLMMEFTTTDLDGLDDLFVINKRGELVIEDGGEDKPWMFSGMMVIKSSNVLKNQNGVFSTVLDYPPYDAQYYLKIDKGKVVGVSGPGMKNFTRLPNSTWVTNAEFNRLNKDKESGEEKDD